MDKIENILKYEFNIGGYSKLAYTTTHLPVRGLRGLEDTQPMEKVLSYHNVPTLPEKSRIHWVLENIETGNKYIPSEEIDFNEEGYRWNVYLSEPVHSLKDRKEVKKILIKVKKILIKELI